MQIVPSTVSSKPHNVASDPTAPSNPLTRATTTPTTIHPTSAPPITALSSTDGSVILPLCEHVACRLPFFDRDARSFRTMTVTQRLSVVRCMLYATATIVNDTTSNELLGTKEHVLQIKHRRVSYSKQNEAAKSRSSFVYAIHGQRLCRQAFSTLVSLNEQTIARHACMVAMAPQLLLYDTHLNRSHEGKLGPRRIIVDGFLNYVASRFALLLPSEMTRTEVYNDYIEQFSKLREAVSSIKGQGISENPLTFSAFTRYWSRGHPTLRIARGGSDFSDFCTSLRNDIAQLHLDDERHKCLFDLLLKHREDARHENDNYRHWLTSCLGIVDDSVQHVVFDLAEKVLLPSLVKQPGQLYFVTGMKFDIFGVHDSNKAATYVFGLPEGHWISEKTANAMISMLHHCLGREIAPRHTTEAVRKLCLHADNCTGQNKNRFVLWYLSWRTIMGFNESVELDFMVAEHTKNVVDGAFGHVKRKLKVFDARTPREMMNIISTSSESTNCVAAPEVVWALWKLFLEKYFRIPNSSSITRYHAFRFEKSAPGKLFAKKFSFSREEKTFSIMKTGVALETIWREAGLVFSDIRYVPVITPLREVKSAQQGTMHGYLVHNMIERYYSEDAEIAREFFEDGTAKH